MDRSRYVIPEPEKFIFLTYRAVGWLAAVVRTRGFYPETTDGCESGRSLN